MIDVSKIKVGDEVTVRVPVMETSKINSLCIRVKTNPWIELDDVLAHHPAPREFAPGDRVVARTTGHQKWEILHVKHPWAWLQESNGWNRLEQLKYLSHADESE